MGFLPRFRTFFVGFLTFLLLALSACAPRTSSSQTTAVPVAGSTLTPDMRELLSAVNVARGQARVCGSQSFGAVSPVSWNDRLSLPALAHAQDMSRRGFFSHTGSDGSDIAERVDRVGYSWTQVGENLAESTPGAYSPNDIVEGWLDSPGHCANIMESAYTEMGAVKLSENLDYWVQVFARP